MLVRIDPAGPPAYRQISDQIRASIHGSRLRAGTRLPAAKDLAASLGVHMHTVLRAYGELRDEGLVDLRPRRGAVVRARPAHGPVVEAARALLARAAEHGLSTEDVVGVIRRLA